MKKVKKVFRDFIIKNLALPDEYSQILADSAKYNTYVETLGNKADNLHLKVKDEYIESLESSFSLYAKNILKKQRFGLIDLVCDITYENFYGKIQGLHIHPWTGENGVKGKFHFLVVIQIDDFPVHITVHRFLWIFPRAHGCIGKGTH